MEDVVNKNEIALKELRKFSFTLSCALIILGGFVLWRKGETGLLFWCIGIVILLMGLTKPRLLGPIHKGWMGMSFLMGFLMTHVILALLYYLVFTPMGLVMRIVRKDPLKLKRDHSAESHWIKRTRREFTRERYEKMF
jgi:hypothetical protein